MALNNPLVFPTGSSKGGPGGPGVTRPASKIPARTVTGTWAGSESNKPPPKAQPQVPATYEGLVAYNNRGAK